MRTLAALLVLVAAPAAAQSRGNLPADFYPGPACEKPVKAQLGGRPNPEDRKSIAAYNEKVKIFNRQAEIFNACMKDYRDRAQNDIDVILATVHAAVAEVNASEEARP